MENAQPLPIGDPSCVKPGDSIHTVGDLLDGSSMVVAEGSPGTVEATGITFGEQNEPQANVTGFQTWVVGTPGFSGGPVINAYGQLIGLNVAGPLNTPRLYVASIAPAIPWLQTHGVAVTG